jgi:predicted unusual protein kinase regulating ubiquinone biosynthesis (AarF/ABC1/UbiB family)
VRVPSIKWEATSRRVITMEWIDGVKLTDEKGAGKTSNIVGQQGSSAMIGASQASGCG